MDQHLYDPHSNPGAADVLPDAVTAFVPTATSEDHGLCSSIDGLLCKCDANGPRALRQVSSALQLFSSMQPRLEIFFYLLRR